MFAILETGSKQYKVEEGDVLEVELLDKDKISKDNAINFDSVLLVNDKELLIGQPFVKDACIQAKVLQEFKAPKIIVFKKKSKKHFKRTLGHRQQLHRIQIEKIEITTPKDKAVSEEPKQEQAQKEAPVKKAKPPKTPAKKEKQPETKAKKAKAPETQAKKEKQPETKLKKAKPSRTPAKKAAPTKTKAQEQKQTRTQTKKPKGKKPDKEKEKE
ncbi:MAG: 50S ribosomal protein L21 [Candidatus Aminicenantes bacterium]|nr:MAG: 50S ribosomal protein L21 [Candidatus Aminicenantes bacterium]